jgi:hypothetical protein
LALAMPAGQRPADLIRSRLWSSEPELSSQILRSQQFFETKFLYENESHQSPLPAVRKYPGTCEGLSGKEKKNGWITVAWTVQFERA